MNTRVADESLGGRSSRFSHVLFVTNEYPPEKTAGTAMSTQFLAEELAGRGYRVTVAVTARAAAVGQAQRGTVQVVPLRPLPVPFTRMAQRAALLGRLAFGLRPDVIQGQSLSCGALAGLAGRTLHIPTVVYVQGLDLYESTRWARRTYIRWALTHCDAAVAVTDDLGARAFAVSGRHAEVIPHGLRMRAAHALDRQQARSLLGLPDDVPIVLHVGRHIRLKGIAYLLRALPHVIASSPGTRLVLVGDGEERATLQAMTRELGVAGAVSFVGARPHEDVIRFMRAADLFVLPSLVESFGIVLVEAMSCGLPIVATDVMGIPSIVDDQINGCLVPPGDDHRLAEQIVWLLMHPAERAVIGRRNIAKAARYAVPRIADRFVALWESLCGAPAVQGIVAPARQGP